jgi:HAD superfamily hydrolase (TIGR01458 family)
MLHDSEGVLLDIDGVLVVSWEPLEGAGDAIASLRARGVPFRLVTNTTSRSRRQIAEALSDLGIRVAAHEVMTAVGATAAYLRSHHRGARVLLLSDQESIEDLEGVALADQGDADVVVIGGASELFSYANVNRAFKLVMAGASLVTVHRSLYWKTSEGLELDGGAYTRALEEAAGVEAVVCGKPATTFFAAAAETIGVPLERTVMVGDDVASDVMAAQAGGATGVLVRTGKFRAADLERAAPHHVVDSVADLPELLEN